MKPSGYFCLLEAADMADQDWNETHTMFNLEPLELYSAQIHAKGNKDRINQRKSYLDHPVCLLSLLLRLHHTRSHTWLGLLPPNPRPGPQEVKLGNTFNTVWIPGLWSYWRNFSLWMETKWRCKASDGKGWQIHYWCHLTFFNLNCDMTSQRTIGDEGFSMGDAHMTAAANHLQQIRWKRKKIKFEKVKQSATGQNVKMRKRKESQGSCFLALFFNPILHHVSHCQSQGIQKIHIKTSISWIISSNLNYDSFTAQTEYFPQDDFGISLLPMHPYSMLEPQKETATLSNTWNWWSLW